MGLKEQRIVEKKHTEIMTRLKHAVEDILDEERKKHPPGYFQYVISLQLRTDKTNETADDGAQSNTLTASADPLTLAMMALSMATESKDRSIRFMTSLKGPQA